MIDFYKRDRYELSGENISDYAHIVDETIDSLIESLCDNKINGCLTKKDFDSLMENNSLSDVLSSFKPKKELNKQFWKDGKLDSRIRLQLLDIVDDFIDTLGIDWVKPADIIITGSICNYNWSKYSDVDLHVLYDYKKIYKKTDFLKTFFDCKKNEWNNNHENLNIYNFPVELYVQDINEPHTASGLYSVQKDKWIKEPEADEFESVKLDKEKIKTKSLDLIKKILHIERLTKKTKDAHKREVLGKKFDELWDKIKKYRQDSLKNGGEMAIGNLVYKVLRRLGFLDRIFDLKNYIYDKNNSLEK